MKRGKENMQGHKERFVHYGYDSKKKRKIEKYFYYLLLAVAIILLLSVLYVMFIGN